MKLRIIDNLDPETLAMLQALYSRSPQSVDDHLAKVTAKGPGKFMESYYVGYGHASIGDCGTTAIFIEGVSMLAAKAIQDWPLYSGQEASTRYMDFSKSEFCNPIGSPEGAAVQERWRKFYMDSMEPVKAHLRDQYPMEGGDNPNAYERTIAARAFDILRGFLPAGAATNLSWTTNLRQANDKIRWLLHHPLAEVREIASDMFAALSERYPSSFGTNSLKTERDKGSGLAVELWTRGMMSYDYYFNTGLIQGFETNIRLSDIEALKQWLKTRPRGAELPHWFDDLGTIRSGYLLDYGSYRDLQRHRKGVIRAPLLTKYDGFESWYIEQLPPDVQTEATNLLDQQERAIIQSSLGHENYALLEQYYIPMGYRVPIVCTQTLPAFVYRLELRSSKTVHPTLRATTLREVAWFRAQFPDVAIHIDDDPSWWTLRRGSQTIEER